MDSKTIMMIVIGSIILILIIVIVILSLIIRERDARIKKYENIGIKHLEI